MFYRGIFKQMKEDNNLDIEELNFYEGYYASFYEEYLKRSNYDIDFYISQGLSAGSKVLELACGTGRVGIPLAKAGFDVTGVDISKDMLAVYKEKLDKEPRRIKKRIKLVNGDITNLELNEKFDLIIFPATTICLFNDEGIVKIFNMVKKHLCEDGKFVFDIADVNDDSYSNDCGQPFMTSWFKDDEYNLVWMQEFKFTDLSEIVLSEDEWDKVVDINMKGTFLMSQGIAKFMIKNNKGIIINIASQHGEVGNVKRAAYCASKAGIINMSRSLAIEWAKYNIRVNCVSPTFVIHDKNESYLKQPAVSKKLLKSIPLGSYCTPKDVADSVLFLASPMARLITGHNLLVDGGYTVQ